MADNATNPSRVIRAGEATTLTPMGVSNTKVPTVKPSPEGWPKWCVNGRYARFITAELAEQEQIDTMFVNAWQYVYENGEAVYLGGSSWTQSLMQNYIGGAPPLPPGVMRLPEDRNMFQNHI